MILPSCDRPMTFTRGVNVMYQHAIWNCDPNCVPLSDPVIGDVNFRRRPFQGVCWPNSRDFSMQPTTILQVYLDEIGRAVMAERFDDYA